MSAEDIPRLETLVARFQETYVQTMRADRFSINFHNLSHLAEQTRALGPLRYLSCYVFERKIKEVSRHPRTGDARTCGRLSGLSAVSGHVPATPVRLRLTTAFIASTGHGMYAVCSTRAKTDSSAETGAVNAAEQPEARDREQIL